MTTSLVCSVRGCDLEAVAVFDANRNAGIPIEYITCGLHHARLESGDLFAASQDREELLMGDDAPVELLNAIVHDDVSGTTFEFVFGRPNGQTLAVHARMSPEQAQSLKRALDLVFEDEDLTPLSDSPQ
jgi:hypothetical protein